jgi:hypothetical protein
LANSFAMDVVVGVLVGDGRHLDQLRAAQAQHVLLLLGLSLRDDDDGAVAACVADQRQADARVAGRAFHHHAAGPQKAALFGILDDEQRGAVFDR